ncbi:hypothetical protein P5V15_002412 [Pogonomyrmex californicus]
MAPSLLRTHGLSTLWLLLLLSSTALASYSIGVGRADSTGPAADIVFMGYAKLDQTGKGLHLRTFSRAFIIDDGLQRFVFVSVDSAMIGNDIRQEVLRKLKTRFGDMYTERNVMISGTHTHSAPGGFMLDVLFDLSTLGFVRQSFNAIVNGITESIQRAHDGVGPGNIRIVQGKVLDANINRSPQAYLNNPKSERDKYEYDVDKILTQLQFIGAERPLGVINWFAVHPTSMNNTNHLISSDNVGYASILFEKMMSNNSLVGKGDFVAAFASTNLGDVSPNTRGPKCEFSGKNCSDHYTCPKKERCFASGPGKDMFESTSIIAHKIYEEALVHGCIPAMGYSFAAGTIDGPGAFAFEQGIITTNPFWNLVRNFLAAPTEDDIRCQSPKPILLTTGRMTFPYQWQPKIISTQLAVIGDVVIAGVPGEFTTMSGRRLREAIKTAMNAPDKEIFVIVAGLCNTYSDYITTPEEYQVQRYEGASTIYGPHTLTIYLKQYRDLVQAAIQNKHVPPGPSPPELLQGNLITLVSSLFFDTASWDYNFGDVILQPSNVASPGDTVTAIFIAGHPRNNLMTDSTFLTIEKLEANEVWIPVATDADWETKFQWERTALKLSQVTITWEIPQDVKPGKYRIRHNGYYRYIFTDAYPYDGVTNHFQVEIPAMK